MALGISLSVALVPLQGVAHVTDEVVYTLQAKLFAEGMRVGPAAENSSMLYYPFWVTEPVSYAAFPPGWPAVLSIGETVGLIWAVNPILSATIPVLIYGIAKEWTDPRTARLAAMISALSPAIWLLGASRMSHTSVLVALASATLVILRKRDGPQYWFAAGASIAYVVLARPYDAFLLGIPLLYWGLIRATDVRSKVILVLPVMTATILLAFDNQTLTGEWHTFPIRRWAETWYVNQPNCDRIGIGSEFGCLGTPHTWQNAASLTWDSIQRLDRSLIGFRGGLALALVGLVLLKQRVPWVLLVLVVGGYALYWSPGAAYGARFYHPVMLVLPIGFATLCLQVRDRWIAQSPDWMIASLMMFCALAGGSRYLPDLASGYWCVDSAVSEMIEEANINEGIIMVYGHGTRTEDWTSFDIEGFTCNDMLGSGSALQLTNPTSERHGLQVRQTFDNPEDRALWLEQEHPNAEAWLYQFDLRTGERSWNAAEKEDDPQEPIEPSMR